MGWNSCHNSCGRESVSYSAHISNGKSAITSKSKLQGVAKHNLRKYKSDGYSSENIILLEGTENLYQDVRVCDTYIID